MFDFAAARRMMVDGQVRTSDVTDPRIIAAMLDLPRERFVPESSASMAYLDRDLPVTEPQQGPARCLLKPMVLAKLVQMAEIGASDRVLDVGCATGYASALLARLAHSVVALESDNMLAQRARAALAAIGADNAEVVVGRLDEGWRAGAPYDAILVDGATEVTPQALLSQLKPAGRLVAVVGRGPASKAMLYRAAPGGTGAVPVFDATAPVLPGFAAAPAFVF
jgi:protein-L-isoaspartate(D-aspartate) O-methyltransferase